MRHSYSWSWLGKIGLAVFVAVVAGCATPVQRAEEFAAQDEWMRSVLEYRKAHVANPGNVEYKSRLKQTELKAADFYYQRGLIQMEQGNLDGAILQFQQGLAAMADHGKLLQVMNQALARKEANTLYEESARESEAGRRDDAMRLLHKAMAAWPDHKGAAAQLAALEKLARDEDGADRIALNSRAPITLNFKQTDIRTAFDFIARSFGVDVIFDDAVKSTSVTLFAKEVTFEQALNLMLATTKTFYKKIGLNTILVFQDNKEKRGQYEDQLVRSFHLNTIRAKDMAEIIKGLVTVKKLIVNELLNAVIVRDTPEVLKLVDKIIGATDRRPAELLLEVEILEVNRTKAERLGLDLGTYQVGAAIPNTAATPASGIPVTGSIRQSIRGALTLTLPSATFNFYKQDVDAKTLANPKVRVVSGKTAKIHIGERVPLRSATIQDATGQIRTTYDYRDVGIRLNVDPTVNLDNSVSVKVGLEVSSLGENLGTAAEPAFRIGTRNAETQMLLRDGETAILGGLIRDEDRTTRVRVPLLGDIPAVGALFSASDQAGIRSDVLLTITPRVVRGWDVPAGDARVFLSGNDERYTTEPVFAGLELSSKARVSVKTDATPATSSSATPASTPTVATPSDSTAATVPATSDAPPQAAALPPVLAFAEAIHEVAAGHEIEVRLTAENLKDVQDLALEVLYNPQLLKFVRAEAGDLGLTAFKAEADAARGVLKVTAQQPPENTGSGGVAARLVMRGEKEGISYLVYRAPTLKNAGGAAVTAQVRASRVVIK